MMPQVEQRHGAPAYVVHRADLHSGLLEYAEEVSEIRVNSMVVSVDFEKPTVTLWNGTTVVGDLIVGADGLSLRKIPMNRKQNFFLTPCRNEIDMPKTHVRETWPGRSTDTNW